MNHKRIHPLTGDEILFVDHTGKENGYLSGNCPFCDRKHLQIIAESENSSIYSIVNKYPVVDDTMRQELIIESDLHDDKFSTMSQIHVEQLLLFIQERIRALQELPNIRYVSYFRNFGFGSGGTQPHPHSQLYALNYIPPMIRQEEQGFIHYLQSKGVCPLCHEIQTAKFRVLFKNTEFQAIAPYASQYPYELWILPTEHFMSFSLVPKHSIKELAEVFHAAMIAFERFFTKHPFNIVLHDGTMPSSHFRFVVYPRLFAPSGFSMSMGSKINGTLPEKAIDKLKSFLPKIVT
ncbi:DUF4931 domain-containing protein [Fodinisporobacter ferrooxydans]|uniref:DUF4931 domain-containing protein n=1 Tax=Fodinisporobacter ferrooxydans TaxID=2901836 RepID=A0ABY4CNV6_9BACL|nr:DUF4931 domain-containing protein [Alicyclobacillaceae bacterium MYW30-H2]